MIKYPYRSTMRSNNSETFDVLWSAANETAENLPFATAFGSSRFDSPDRLPIDRLGEIYTVHPPFNPIPNAAWLKGDHVCGSADFWLNGWPPGTPTLPVDENGVARCCGDEPAAFDFGFDLGFDS